VCAQTQNCIMECLATLFSFRDVHMDSVVGISSWIRDQKQKVGTKGIAKLPIRAGLVDM